MEQLSFRPIQQVKLRGEKSSMRAVTSDEREYLLAISPKRKMVIGDGGVMLTTDGNECYEGLNMSLYRQEG